MSSASSIEGIETVSAHANAFTKDAEDAEGESEGAKLHLFVTEHGFEPARIRIPRDELVTLIVLRKTDRTCAREIVIPELGVHRELPLGEPIHITFVPRASGPIRYGCASDRTVSGILAVV